MDVCMYVGKSKYHNHKALMYSISCHRSKKFKRYHRCVYIYLSRSHLLFSYFTSIWVVLLNCCILLGILLGILILELLILFFY